MIHFFDQPVSHIALPERFTYPFNYTPHPLCVLAAEEVKAYISTQKEWQEELAPGKMFGVLIVQPQEEEPSPIGYLAAFSGNLAGKNLHPYFVPPVYDLLQPQGFFKIEEEQISAINARISELEVNPHYLHLKEKLNKGSQRRKKTSPQLIPCPVRRRTGHSYSRKSISESGIQTIGTGMERTDQNSGKGDRHF